ncbi:uncharacterized protein C8Q71DRAFT_263772 [Rhodofomes roseus]|uniref:F-box domain-containing protein n=1 Tax=Rhodofomes roseus TaxID=34475 RepID=A0ABQ8K6N1_9APHY|nr:uncharacterized protein C8Q71DRAFT_263772 [Rhodofomes roseus]KAH9832666.1 hypothetical protein C8Q71DRAFT_263772 [Rhodofomes roseus]
MSPNDQATPPPYEDTPYMEVVQWSATKGCYHASPPRTLRPALSARIPHEVIEFIINGMDTPTLAAAALVCAIWYSPVMRNLYFTVELHDRTSFDLLFKQSRTSPRVRHWLATTRELVASDPHPSLLNAIEAGDLSLGQERKTARFLHSLPLAFGRTMSSVRALSVSDLHRFTRPEFFRYLAQFKSLKALALSRCTLSASQLRRIICAVPQLEALTLEGNILADEGPFDSPPVHWHLLPPTSTRLRRLGIHLDASDGVSPSRHRAIVDCLVRSGFCASLNDIAVRGTDHPSWKTTLVDELLEAAGPALTRYSEDGFPHGRHGNLARNAALRSLDFSLLGPVVAGAGQSIHSWSKVSDDLRSVLVMARSHQLEHIVIRIDLPLHLNATQEMRDALNQRSNLMLRDLHNLMYRPDFATLKGVEVSVRLLYASRDGKEAEVESIKGSVGKAIRLLLRPWHGRGVLHLSWRNS